MHALCIPIIANYSTDNKVHENDSELKALRFAIH